MIFSTLEILPNTGFSDIVWYFLDSSMMLSLAKSHNLTLHRAGTDPIKPRYTGYSWGLAPVYPVISEEEMTGLGFIKRRHLRFPGLSIRT